MFLVNARGFRLQRDEPDIRQRPVQHAVCPHATDLSGLRGIPVCLHPHSRIVPSLVQLLPSLLFELFFRQLMIWNANERERRNFLDLFLLDALLLIACPSDSFL